MRKKYAGSFIVALTILTLAGCGQGENNQLSKIESVPYSNEGNFLKATRQSVMKRKSLWILCMYIVMRKNSKTIIRLTIY